MKKNIDSLYEVCLSESLNETARLILVIC